MTDRIVVNTGPLVALARADALAIVGALRFVFICPGEVRAELDAGAAQGHPAVDPSWVRVVPLREPLDPVASAALDAGEAAVIQLALEQGVGRVGIDERKGRAMARAVGLEVVGTLGLLLRAKRDGHVSALRPYVERMSAAGTWFHADLIRRVLEAAGEQTT